jgi:DNA replicative helicase MCM subunit Mcm2 (Cdc46/Mcm family)
VGARAWPVTTTEVLHKIFYFFLKIRYHQAMFKSIPFTPRKVEATEARLQAIYDAAALGLKGDSLALAAGLLPTEYRQLCELDPVAAMAEQKGRADSEMEASMHLREAARAGDAKAALAILQHSHGWTARQEISVDITNRISITQALQQAQERVIDGLITEQKPEYLEHATANERTRTAA